MKLIQALNELKLIRKKVVQNYERLANYSSSASNNLKFDTEEEQQNYVDSIVQSNSDLIKQYTKIKTQVDKTNLETKVDTEYGSFTLAELLLFRGEKNKPGLIQANIDTIRNLNDGLGDQEVDNHVRSSGYDKENPVKVIRFFDVKERDDEITRLTEFKERVDGIIEVTNAETDLVN